MSTVGLARIRDLAATLRAPAGPRVQIELGQALHDIANELEALAFRSPPPASRPPRVIDAILGRNHHTVIVVVANILAIEIEPVLVNDVGVSRAWLLMGKVIHADDVGCFACYRDFDTEEQALAFLKETLG